MEQARHRALPGGELKRSLADCDEVMKRNPNHFGALAGYGQIYFQLEQYEKAIEYWKRALRVNPNMEASRTASRTRRRSSRSGAGTRLDLPPAVRAAAIHPTERKGDRQ
jgi:tetratricopeptide (TPR) repeat protein